MLMRYYFQQVCSFFPQLLPSSLHLFISFGEAFLEEIVNLQCIVTVSKIIIDLPNTW